VKYRKLAVSRLQLKPGDRVVEIGCGTGLNFQYLLDAIGQTGRLIGIDLTDAMLVKAKERVRRSGWPNVEIVQTDAATFGFPSGIDGAISTFALTLVPEYEKIIKRVPRALKRGGRLVVADFKKPDHWPMWIVKLGILLTKPFGVSLDLAERRPWELMQKHFSKVETTQVCTAGLFTSLPGKRPEMIYGFTHRVLKRETNQGLCFLLPRYGRKG
jgi:ubiquinone/menaquinone biosynthesis C-methylase UbiE